MRTSSCCAVFLYDQNNLLYQRVNVFVTFLGTSQHFFYDNASFQFGGLLRGKKHLFGFIWFEVFVCFGRTLLPYKGPQKFILRSCVKAKLCKENLFQALVDVHAGFTLCDGTSSDHDRRLQ